MIDHKLYYEDIQNVVLQYKNVDLDNAKILITGASGLIGTVLTDVFMNMDKNISVTVMSRGEDKIKQRFGNYIGNDRFNYVLADVNFPILECGDFDYIIHAASNTHPTSYSSDPIGTITANIIGTKNLLDYAILHHTKRFIFLSTVEIYGENRGDVEKFSEDYCGYIDCNTTRAGYPESKRVGESLCQSYAQKYGIDVVIPRICRVYGATMSGDDSKALAQFIRNAVNGEDIVLKSKGNQLFSYCYVSDIVSGIIKIMLDGKSGEAYNISDPNSDITLADLAGLLAKNAGTKVIFELPNENEAKGFSKVTKALLDSTKLRVLGWETLISIEQGVRRTLGILKSIQ